MTYFTEREFYCKCCGRAYMDRTFLDMLNRARTISGIPYVIMSGYRCPRHDAEVDGKGNHDKGTASDIECNTGLERLKILNGLLTAGFKRIGIGKTFIHADCTPGRPNSIWLY